MDFPSLTELKARNTLKWTRYGDDVLPLWVAEADFRTCPEVIAAIMDAVQRESFGYPPDGHGLAPALAAFSTTRYGWDIDPARIFPVPDVVRGVYLALSFLTKPESPTIIPAPAYMPFWELTAATGRETMVIDAYGGLDLNDIEDCFKRGAGSLILCNPYNPLGYTFSREFLIELADLTARYDARIISDEIHGPLVYDGTHIPAASVSDTAAQVCVTVTATSKAWNIAGLKCAQMIFTNDEDVARWNAVPWMLRDGVSILGLVAAQACYEAPTSFLEDQVAQLKANRDFLVEELPKRAPGVLTANPEATYLMWLDFRNTPLADRPAAQLMRKARIALNEGTTFGQGGEGHARLNFACSPDTLEIAIDRIASAVAG